MREVLLQSPYELHGSSLTELVYEVTVPFDQKIRPLTRLLGQLDGQNGTSVKWEIKKYETDRGAIGPQCNKALAGVRERGAFRWR